MVFVYAFPGKPKNGCRYTRFWWKRAEREEGAIRTLRNSWQPFTVDAFIAVEQERANAARLRRQASASLQGLSEPGYADAKTGGS